MFFKKFYNQKGKGFFEVLMNIVIILGAIAFLGPKACSLIENKVPEIDMPSITINQDKKITIQIPVPKLDSKQKEEVIEKPKVIQEQQKPLPDPEPKENGGMKRL